MTDLQKVSIVMPFKNTSQYLRACIESITNQNHINFELLAVDDHSTDNSFDLVASYAAKDSRVKVFKNPGRGILQGLDYIYSKCTGNFITRMDSDDLMPANKLFELKSILESSTEKTVATGLVKYFCDEHDVFDGFTRYQNWLNDLSKTSTHYQDIYTECPVASPCWMMYKADYDSIGAYSVHHYPEDYDLFYRWYEAGFKIKASHQILHLWRDHSTRASRTDPNYLDQCFFKIKLNYFKKLHYCDQSPLVVWGAGPKGKKLVKELQSQGFSLRWICDNPKKIGQNIYGIQLENIEVLSEINKPTILLAVSQKHSKTGINNTLDRYNLEINKDFFNFVI
ncbi:MAG: glycosyltransferase family 2 protein [Candidatus Cloacimonetes bacterium]|nr:glycosyltransferase family 2 protein [Candidatus Cloacimonadota bacterium]